MIRNTMNYGETEVNADTEVVYETVDGMKTIIPYSEKWTTVFVQTSGGIDSALLLYLVSKTFKKLNSKAIILPVSLEVPSKAKNLSSARAVVKKVQELTEYPHLRRAIEFHIPIDQCENPLKDAFFNDTLVNLFESLDGSFELNGNTKNPPEEARSHFHNDSFRQMQRDNRTTVYNSPYSASPHALVNKKGIIALYKSEGIIDELANLTLSCDMNMEEILRRHLTIPCHECWWCDERAWGFSSNNIIDKSLENKKTIPTNENHTH